MTATSVAVTPGSGAPIAVDQVGGIDYQRVKLVDGTIDSTTVGEISAPADGVSKAGLWVNAESYVYDAGTGLFLRRRGDSSGRAIVVGAAAAGAAVAGNPLLVGGSDGANARALLLDGSGRAIVVGSAADGAADAGNPVKIGGKIAALDPTPSFGTVGNRKDASFDAGGRLAVIPPLQWTLTHAPAANTQATATKAAGGVNVRHVLTSLYACVHNSGAATATVLTVVVRDGASGGGTILWTLKLAVLATTLTLSFVFLNDLHIVGTANTATTVEFTGAGGANTNEVVNACGYDTV